MAVCRFFQQGYCRYGNNCKFEHPQGGQQNYNRFGALGGQTNQGTGARAADTPPYPGLTVDAIQRDLSNELPQWILSCYGPGRDAPEQLWGGYPREQSPEEIRMHFMMGQMAGNPQGALNDIEALYQNARQQIQHALSNIPAAIQFIVDAEKKHPNRIDICKSASGGTASGGPFGSTANAFQKPAQPTNPFGAPAAPATTVGAFGQPSALGQKPNPFGAPSTGFGEPAKPAASAFGQPSALGGTSAFGRPANTAFGQTSTLGAKPNPFGTPALSQPAQPAGGSAFGQSAFGQPATLGVKPNPFGAPAPGPSPFGTVAGGAAATQPPANPFGQPAQQAQTTASPFGQTASTQPAANPFGQPATANPFGQPATAQANPFGQPQQQQHQPATGPFGAPATAAAPVNPFGQPATTSPFGAPATTNAPTATAFGQQPSAVGSTAGFGAAASTSAAPAAQAQNPYGPNATRQHPDISTYASKGPDGLLRMFKGKPVTYQELKPGTNPVPVIRNFDGSVVRIWMPNGAPAYTAETEAERAKYEDPNVMQQWKAFVETGKFAGGVMPEVPPRREFCTWDF
ncbi:hypothetical protein C8A03DRAFT_38652 [Achaetomium macrosporum]|uniref:C3H1-type domain-containing protein n=1 Tax=Achaetomium macrosporum TaxID=79813 RepID=A0AAN7HA26_9PEZI|nr:hypothetical protein C8A03DRAFT_38652 [Achaetomium macrosporum]